MDTGYAADILDFSVRFHTEEACFEYLRAIRWPDGFMCPACGHRGGWWLKKYFRFECSSCHRQTSPLSGTVMHRSHLPLRLWFWAAYFVSTHTPGISAVQLQRQLSIKKVDSAWYLLHRLRRGMIRQNRERLAGTVEADETHIGGPVKGKTGRGVAKAKTKTLIAGAVEIVTYTQGITFERKQGVYGSDSSTLERTRSKHSSIAMSLRAQITGKSLAPKPNTFLARVPPPK